MVAPHVPSLWPQRAEGFPDVPRSLILVALGTALLTLSAKVNLPLPCVPRTLQSSCW
jgi:biotin transport system substrate-specific component